MLVSHTLPSRGQYAGRESIYLTIEAVGKHRGHVEDTVIVRVDQQAYPVRVVGQPLTLWR